MTRIESDIRKNKIRELLSQGKARKEIAEELKLNIHTLNEFLNRIIKKSGCRNSTEWVVKEIQVK